MVTQSYGSYSPAAIDPFPIETELAKAAITSPAQAQNLLDLYQTQRATSEGNYNYAMAGQHDFAKKQLEQQLYEANLKALPEMAKPGVARLLQGAPGYQGVFGGADQDTIAQSVGQAEAANQAEVLSKAGSGANAFSQAGYGIPIPALEGMTGVTGLTPQTPRDIEIAKINAAARLGAASIGASAQGGIGYNIPLRPSDATGGAEASASIPKKMGLQAGVAELRRIGALPPAPVEPPLPGGAGKPNVPNLPMAQTDNKPAPTAPAKAPAKVLPNATKGVDLLQQRADQWVETEVRTKNPKMYADIQAYKAQNGGKVGLIGPDKNGQYKIQGKEHTY